MQIKLNIGEIKRIIGAKTVLDDSFFIKNISSLENAEENDLVVVLDKGARDVFGSIPVDKIKKSNAGIILAKKEIVSGKNYLLVDNPLNAFQKIVDFVQNQDRDSKKIIDPSAVISKTAVLKDNVKIGPHSFVGEKVIIGSNVTIGPGAKILDRCEIGDNSIIYAGAVIGSDGFGYKVTDKGMQKIPQIGIVKIGQNVEIGANTTIDRAAFDQTVIGNGVKIDNNVHIAHNVIVGDHTVILAQTGIAGSVKIGFGCMIGGQVAIRDHVKIGNNVKIVSKSGVMNDIKDGQAVAGIPAIPFGQWKRICVIISRLPEVFKDKGLFRRFFQSGKF